MNTELQKKWDEAEATGNVVAVGRIVVCDSCSGDFTTSPDSGGIIFSSSAYCPACTERMMPTITGFGETYLIRAKCPQGVSFADFVRTYRGPHAGIQVVSLG